MCKRERSKTPGNDLLTSGAGMTKTIDIKEHAQAARRTLASAKAAALALAIVAIACGPQHAQAGEREQAKRMFDRLTGTPPTPEQLDAVTTALGSSPTHAQRTSVALSQILDSADGRNFYS